MLGGGGEEGELVDCFAFAKDNFCIEGVFFGDVGEVVF